MTGSRALRCSSPLLLACVAFFFIIAAAVALPAEYDYGTDESSASHHRDDIITTSVYAGPPPARIVAKKQKSPQKKLVAKKWLKSLMRTLKSPLKALMWRKPSTSSSNAMWPPNTRVASRLNTRRYPYFLGDNVDVQILDRHGKFTGRWATGLTVTGLHLDGRVDLNYPNGIRVTPALSSGIRPKHLREAARRPRHVPSTARKGWKWRKLGLSRKLSRKKGWHKLRVTAHTTKKLRAEAHAKAKAAAADAKAKASAAHAKAKAAAARAKAKAAAAEARTQRAALEKMQRKVQLAHHQARKAKETVGKHRSASSRVPEASPGAA